MLTLEDYLQHNARLYPDKPAMVCGAETCSYLQLYDRCRARAADFASDKGRVHLFRASQTIDFVTDYMALHMAGAVAAPLEHDTPQLLLDEMAANIAAKPPHPSSGEPIADVLFTTGTTGRSKGVMISHRAIIANAENLIAGQGFTHDLTFIVNGPLNHIGSLSKIYPVIVLGATLYILPGMKDMNQFFEALDYNVPKMATFFVPATVRMLLQLAPQRLASYAHKLDFIECGGAPLPHADMLALCRLLPATRLYNTYASTETGIVSTYNYNDGRCLAGCLGHPMPHSTVFITPDGRIACQGDTLMSGYLGDPELTGAVLRDGTVYTADLGHIDDEGMLYISGRQDDVINIGGYKVAPTEVEEAALLLPDIEDCICTTAPHPITGLALKLLVVMADGRQLNKRLVAQHLATRLERYKVPMLYEQADHIERTYNGKLNRKYYKESRQSHSL